MALRELGLHMLGEHIRRNDPNSANKVADRLLGPEGKIPPRTKKALRRISTTHPHTHRVVESYLSARSAATQLGKRV